MQIISAANQAASFFFNSATPERAMPSSMSVAPLSGMALAEAEKDQVSGPVPVFGSWLVKLQDIVVGV